jgi:hypothetical protein
MTPFKTFQEAAVAIDDMVAAQAIEGELIIKKSTSPV